MATEAQASLIERARKAQGAENKKVPAKLRPILAPTSIETRYTAMLLDFVKFMGELVDEQLVPQIPNYVAESDAVRPKTDSIERIDAWPTQLNNTIKSIEKEIDNSELKPNAQDFEEIATDVSSFNANQINLVIEQGLGINIFVPEPWLELEIEAFTQQNLSLIGSLEDEYLRKVEEAVNRGVQAGDRAEDIAKELEHIEDVTQSRAKLIARDQVSKLNGNLNMLRQENLGIDSYIWRTAEDERVRGDPSGRYPNARPSHFDKNGKTFKWDNPPSDTGHPGEDFQCRCYAEPNLQEFLDGI